MHLEILSYIPNKENRLKDLQDIFFLTAKTPLKSEDEKKSLFQKYAQPYIEHWPDFVFFACDEKTGRTMGYLIGCVDAKQAQEVISPLQKSYDLFSDLHKKYPAHLHINIHPDFQGHGVGTFLVQEFIVELKKFGAKGVHILTAPNERNVDFYFKNKFKFRTERQLNDKPVLFMGLAL
jgi:GNAT superfamily N-acetyltransferase